MRTFLNLGILMTCLVRTAAADILLTPGQFAVLEVSQPTRVSCDGSVPPTPPPSTCTLKKDSLGYYRVLMEGAEVFVSSDANIALGKLKEFKQSGLCVKSRCRIFRDNVGYYRALLDEQELFVSSDVNVVLNRVKELQAEGFCR